jgi:RNA 2',3'-cyclic 3'-phosphodiesterase
VDAEPEHARLFVALELPGDVRATLSDWGRAQLTDVARLRRVRTESLHVTLCFLGAQPVSAMAGITAACQVAASLPAVALSLGETLWLPQRRPRVLAVSLADEQRRLAALQSELSAALHAGGFYEPERRPFLGHVTVARVASGTRQRPLEVPPPPALHFDATGVTLYRSWLGSGPGGRGGYEALSTVALAG